jgi:osmotically-inducible protein OsmY
MLGSLLRAVVLVVVLLAAAAFLLGWLGSRPFGSRDASRDTVGTTGIDADRAREVGAQIGERTAEVASTASQAFSDANLTAKIKAKMALDDSIKALDIDVDTAGSTVTLSGAVDSNGQRERALRLARETVGVAKVVDNLRVK